MKLYSIFIYIKVRVGMLESSCKPTEDKYKCRDTLQVTAIIMPHMSFIVGGF